MADIDAIADGTGAEIARAYRAGEADPVAVTECLLDRIEKSKSANIFITVTAARARSEAKASAARYRSGAPLSPLDGVPLAWKDLIDIAETRTTGGSRHFSTGPIKTADQVCVAHAAAAGMVTLGKVNLSELAYSALGLNPHFGTPPNPNDPIRPRAPGGSSSGCGVAVAARLVPCAIGSDTGGSVRIPAAFNGVTGFKTSHGRLDTSGVMPLARSYDTLGPLAHSVEDCLLLDRILRGAKTAQMLHASAQDITVVAPSNVVTAQAEAAVVDNFERTLESLARAGITVRRQRVALLDEVREITARHGTLAAAEAYQEYRHVVDGACGNALDRRVLHRLLGGKAMTADDVIAIQRARQRLIPELTADLGGAFLVMPTCPITAPEIAPLEADDDLFHKVNLLAGRNTMLGNILDLCAVALPNGRNAYGLPTSVQLAAPHGDDDRLLAAAREVERLIAASGW